MVLLLKIAISRSPQTAKVWLTSNVTWFMFAFLLCKLKNVLPLISLAKSELKAHSRKEGSKAMSKPSTIFKGKI